jgi:MFS family permease
LLASLAAGTPVPYLLCAYAVFGLGFALVSPPIANTAVSGMPPAQAGVASAVATTSRQVGLTLGVAIFGILVGDGAGYGNELGPGFAAASHRGWWIVAALGFSVAALGHLTTTRRAQETARRTAARLVDSLGDVTKDEGLHLGDEVVREADLKASGLVQLRD